MLQQLLSLLSWKPNETIGFVRVYEEKMWKISVFKFLTVCFHDLYIYIFVYTVKILYFIMSPLKIMIFFTFKLL
jgi:hypothetical protein